jgi:hypothetical protein
MCTADCSCCCCCCASGWPRSRLMCWLSWAWSSQQTRSRCVLRQLQNLLSMQQFRLVTSLWPYTCSRITAANCCRTLSHSKVASLTPRCSQCHQHLALPCITSLSCPAPHPFACLPACLMLHHTSPRNPPPPHPHKPTPTGAHLQPGQRAAHP